MGLCCPSLSLQFLCVCIWWGGPFLHPHYLFFCSIFVFQLSGIVCANYAQLPSLSLRTVPDRREKNDAVVSEMFLAWFSFFSKNGFECPISLSRAINTNREIILKKKQNKTKKPQTHNLLCSEGLHEIASVSPQHNFTASSPFVLTQGGLCRAEPLAPVGRTRKGLEPGASLWPCHVAQWLGQQVALFLFTPEYSFVDSSVNWRRVTWK